MTITQTVEVPANRRLLIDIPNEVPTGRINVIIQFPAKEDVQRELTAQQKNESNNVLMTRKELDEFLQNAHTPIADSLLGILKTDMTIDEIRMARLAKHL